MQALLSYARGLFWLLGIVHILVGLALPFLIAARTSRRPTAIVIAAILGLLVAGCGLLSCQAARAMKRQGRGARIWVALGSLIQLPEFPFGTAAGIVGLLWCFWPKLRAVEPPAEDFEYKPQPGDGTHPWMQKCAPFLSVVIWILAMWAAGKWGDAHGLPRRGAVNGLLLLFGCELIVVALHEAGHALAARLNGMSLLSFCVGPIVAKKRSGQWKVQFSLAALLQGGGSMVSAPLHLNSLRPRMAWEIAGGPLASILTALAAFKLLQMMPGSPWEAWWNVPAVITVIAGTGSLINLIPFRFAAGFSDGAALVQILRGGPMADVRMATKMMGATLVSPVRPRDVDTVAIERAVAVTAMEDPQRMPLQFLTMLSAIDRGNLAEAQERLQVSLNETPTPEKAPTAATAAEMATYLAYLDGTADRAEPWLRAAEERAMREGKPITDGFDYWCAATAVNQALGFRQQAEETYRRAAEFAARRPANGLYAFEWELLNELYRRAWIEKPAEPVAAC